MKLTANPLKARQGQSEESVNRFFNRMATSRTHIDAVHRRKRADAKKVAAGEQVEDVSFAAEAERLGKTLTEFADVILSKPDDMVAREDKRRQIIETIRAAKNSDEIQAVLNEHDISSKTS